MGGKKKKKSADAGTELTAEETEENVENLKDRFLEKL